MKMLFNITCGVLGILFGYIMAVSAKETSYLWLIVPVLLLLAFTLLSKISIRATTSVNRKIVKATYENEIMVIFYSDGMVEQFHGGSTVWHWYPEMKRCNISTEYKLSEIWSYIKVHGNPYPTSHGKL